MVKGGKNPRRLILNVVAYIDSFFFQQLLTTCCFLLYADPREAENHLPNCPTKDGRFSSLSQYQRIWEEAPGEGIRELGPRLGIPGPWSRGTNPCRQKTKKPRIEARWLQLSERNIRQMTGKMRGLFFWPKIVPQKWGCTVMHSCSRTINIYVYGSYQQASD